ncbi:hypothetical protein JAAARDRAFT_198798 [Jaapia argillacea MUCL 33604]|uniref:Uncharacterized protein n=1 Tax=Jaapia argillacea MUCL 33604 TaxID=933084 RepID=A0A067PLR9_9AGAM|nr:hypothetical protein JAAARDRAFT_198798 [Jaapia argillacea MUCL 33604]
MVSIVWWGYAIWGGSVDVEDGDLMSVIDDVQWVLRSMLESNTSRLVDDNEVAPSPVVSKGNRKRCSTSEAGGEGVAPKKKRFVHNLEAPLKLPTQLVLSPHLEDTKLSSGSDPARTSPIRGVHEDEILADVSQSTSLLAITIPSTNANSSTTPADHPAHLVVLPEHILSLMVTLNHPPPDNIPNKVHTPLIFRTWRDRMVELVSELCLEEGDEWEDALHSGLSLNYISKLVPMLDRIIACMAEFQGLSKFWAAEVTRLKHEHKRIIAVYQASLHHWCAVGVGVVPASEILI